MRGWIALQYWARDNVILIAFLFIAALFGLAWLIIEALRSHQSRDEIFRLRQRLYELERSRGFTTLDSGSIVLQSRWIRVGGAATTSDGGCFLLVEAASPIQKKVSMTVRVDGLPAKRNATMAVGQRMEIEGKSGTYSIELHGTEPQQARLNVWLRTRHVEVLESN